MSDPTQGGSVAAMQQAAFDAFMNPWISLNLSGASWQVIKAPDFAGGYLPEFARVSDDNALKGESAAGGSVGI